MKLVSCLLLAVATPLAAAVPLDPTPYVREDAFHDIKLSPDGKYLAATVPLEDRVGLAILRTGTSELTASINLGPHSDFTGFWWISGERVMAGVAQKLGSQDEPVPTGELVAIDVDGSRAELLAGQRDYDKKIGSNIRTGGGDKIAAWLIDDLPRDDDFVLIATQPFTDDPYRKIDRLAVYGGRRKTLGRAPVRNGWFATDNRGVVRFAFGYGTDLNNELYYRASDADEWTRVNDEDESGRIEHPVGFSADDRLAYLLTERTQGPDVLVEFDPATGARRTVLEDDDVSPSGILYRNGTRVPVGARFEDGVTRVAFIDDAAPEARLQRSLEAAFAGHAVQITSMSADGGLALVLVYDDRNPGDFYLFDTVRKKADFLLARRDWFDPASMAKVEPIALKARDGLALRGFLTVPHGSAGKDLPLVVLPHGGPFGLFDAWGFDAETQLLAAAGYAVLQVNFRGSGNHGRAFENAGAREWGGKMQDDVTDATRWAIAQGIADPKRICIHGASYGAYAALMGAAREPALYRCASGYVGVYDLPMMHRQGDVQSRGSGETYLREWIGAPEELADVSPVNLAAKIRVPVLLAAGGEDERAPVQHTKRMEKALKKAGVPVQSLYYATEGHGFYTLEHRREYYAKLLAFLAEHLDGKPSAP